MRAGSLQVQTRGQTIDITCEIPAPLQRLWSLKFHDAKVC